VGTSGNFVRANYIGTKINGTEPLGNGQNGISVSTADPNTIGGLGADEGNHNSTMKK
jgi:hypothetical protein